MKYNKAGELKMKLNSLTRKTNRNFLIGATLVVLAVLHFTFSRFIAIEIEKDSTEIEVVNHPPVETDKKPKNAGELESPKPEIVKTIEPQFAPARKIKPEIEAKRETEKENPVARKKVAPRETRAERLRRAERLLTGV